MTVTGPQRQWVAAVAALSVETQPLRRAPHAPALRIIQAGPGPQACTRAVSRAVAQGAGALVSWGFAGGLTRELGSGGVLLASRVIDGSGRQLRGDDAWRERLQNRMPAGLDVRNDGLLLASDTVLLTPADKALAAASSGAQAVDMETFALAAAADKHGLPWVAVRIVLDTSTDSLPRGVQQCVDANGTLRWRGVLRLLAQPGGWHGLATAARCSRQARASLAVLARALGPVAFAAPGLSAP